MRALFSPRMLLLVWGGIGAIVFLYVIVAASVKTSDRAKAVDSRDPSLLVGEMADFAFAFPPRGAPEIAFEHAGQQITIADFRGRAILVNLWATWCAPCLKELPSLDALEAALGGADFEVVAIAADPRGPEVAREFLDRLEIKSLKLYADQRLRFASAVGGPNVLPVSILYDAKGREVGRLVGEADWQSPEARRLVQATIAAR